MPDRNLNEVVTAAEARYSETGTEFDKKIVELLAARDAENEARSELEASYKKLFESGLIIVSVAKPYFCYELGYKDEAGEFEGLFADEKPDEGDVYEDHAQAMVGKFASRVTVSIPDYRLTATDLQEMRSPQESPQIAFEIDGPHIIFPAGLVVPDNPSTYYWGSLNSLEWELPPDQEPQTAT